MHLPWILASAVVAGFLLGHGLELVIDLVPLLVIVTLGFLALSATDLLYERD